MKKIALAAACLAAIPLAYAGPFDAFKGHMKPGMYESKIDMDMGAIPGMPPGMGKQSMTHQHCITQEDIDSGKVAKEGRSGKKGDGDCEIKDVKMSGNTGTYRMVCPKGNMTVDSKITFMGNGYSMDSVMNMDQSGQKVTMKQHTESKYIGACK
jgi:hypothetical protein